MAQKEDPKETYPKWVGFSRFQGIYFNLMNILL